ncbi:MAG: hypothetical protein NZ551_02615 [Microscillaceae bacterium]|nr:hypothetical protein [Microscillaceae bacterium]MDW8460079.1 hypothetical protein [Cytophagales bacterium]
MFDFLVKFPDHSSSVSFSYHISQYFISGALGIHYLGFSFLHYTRPQFIAEHT